MRSFLFLLSSCMIHAVISDHMSTTAECGKECNDGSRACCVREGCGCVELSGWPTSFDGCTQNCKAPHNSLCCPEKCKSSSKSCCVVSKECGCSDLEEHVKNGGSAHDCRRTCGEGSTCATTSGSDSYTFEDAMQEEQVDDVLPAGDIDGASHSGSLGVFWFLFGFVVASGFAVLYFKFKDFNSKFKGVPMVNEFEPIN